MRGKEEAEYRISDTIFRMPDTGYFVIGNF